MRGNVGSQVCIEQMPLEHITGKWFLRDDLIPRTAWGPGNPEVNQNISAPEEHIVNPAFISPLCRAGPLRKLLSKSMGCGQGQGHGRWFQTDMNLGTAA